MYFIRDKSVPYPQVWRRFERKDTQGSVRRFKVQDATPGDWKQILHHVMDHFLNDEPTCKVKNLKTDPISVKEIQYFFEEALKSNVTLVCYEEASNEDKFVGFNIHDVECYQADDSSSNEALSKLNGKGWRQIMKILIYGSSIVQPFQRYKTDIYLSGCGLCVLPEYRGFKIGGEILKAREPLCKALNIKATVTVFTSIPSQKLATNVGFELLKELPYDCKEFQEMGIDFTGIISPSCKVMGIKYID